MSRSRCALKQLGPSTLVGEELVVDMGETGMADVLRREPAHDRVAGDHLERSRIGAPGHLELPGIEALRHHQGELARGRP